MKPEAPIQKPPKPPKPGDIWHLPHPDTSRERDETKTEPPLESPPACNVQQEYSPEAPSSQHPEFVQSQITSLANILFRIQVSFVQHKVRGKWARAYFIVIVVYGIASMIVLSYIFADSCSIKNIVNSDIENTAYLEIINKPNVYYCGSSNPKIEKSTTNDDIGYGFNNYCCKLKGIDVKEHKSKPCERFKQLMYSYEPCYKGSDQNVSFCGKDYASVVAVIDYVECTEPSQAIVFAVNYTVYGLFVLSIIYLILRRFCTRKSNISQASLLDIHSWNAALNNSDEHARLVETITQNVLNSMHENNAAAPLQQV